MKFIEEFLLNISNYIVSNHFKNQITEKSKSKVKVKYSTSQVGKTQSKVKQNINNEKCIKVTKEETNQSKVINNTNKVKTIDNDVSNSMSNQNNKVNPKTNKVKTVSKIIHNKVSTKGNKNKDDKQVSIVTKPNNNKLTDNTKPKKNKNNTKTNTVNTDDNYLIYKSDTFIDKNIIDINLPAEEEEFNRFVIAAMNPGGLRSKVKTVENAAIRNKVNAIIVTETHYAALQRPYLAPNFTAFYKNRSKFKSSCKGGVAIFLDKNHAEHAVILSTGENDEQEYISIKLNNYNPPLVIMAIYGPQESAGKKVEELWIKYKGLWEHYIKQGWKVIIGGDLNAAVGLEFGIKENHKSMNTAGKWLSNNLNSDLEVLNARYLGDQRTHIDRSSNLNRSLDYLITNAKEECKEFAIDNELQATPYRVTMKNGKPDQRKFTDHKTIMARFTLKKEKVKEPKQKAKFIKTELSKAKFSIKTDQIAEECLELIAKGTNSTTIVNRINRKMKKAKFSSHTVVKPNRPAKISNDEAIFWNTTKMIENECKNTARMKINNQIFNIRKKIKMKEGGEQLRAMKNKEGKIVDTKEDILEVLLKHNEDLLKRKEHPAEFKELHNMKKKLQDILQSMNITEFKTITIDDYLKAVDKVFTKKKSMFEDFRDASPKFKAMIYWLLRKIYEEGDIPEEFLRTNLVALYKKGDPQLASNYRYIHLKEYLARLLENVIYIKLEACYDKVTGESQSGGMKKNDCNEHLVVMMNLIKQRQEEGEGVIFTFADIEKCFDMLHMPDAHYFIIINNADLKAVQVLNKLVGTNRITVNNSENSFEIQNGQGQGGICVGRSASGSITEVMERNAAHHPEPAKLFDQNVQNSGFVDDTATADTKETGSKISCAIITDTFNELSLRAHPTKTVQVICGTEDYIKEKENKLKIDPAQVQNFKVKTVKKEKYLGMTIYSGTTSDIIDINIKEKAGKIYVTATDIRKLVREPQIERKGALKTAALMIQSQILPKLLYSTVAWINISKEQYKAMEEIFKESIIRILSLPDKTPYDALLLEIGNYHIENWIDCLRIKYFMKKMHWKGYGRLYRIIRDEIYYNIKSGIANDIKELCDKYNIPNVILQPVSEDYISEKCKEISRMKSRENIDKLRKIPKMLSLYEDTTEHHTFPMMEARAITAWRTGTLVFKNWCPYRFRLKYQGDRKCLYPPCQGDDTLFHVREECEFYSTKFIQTSGSIKDWAEYLVKLNKERMREFKQPLILMDGWKEGWKIEYNNN